MAKAIIRKKVTRKAAPMKAVPRKNAYEMTLISSILAKSVSVVYDEAKREWDFTGTVNDYGPVNQQKPTQKCQLCGHPIRYGYILNNKKNSNIVEVGSECVGNYLNISDKLIDKMNKAKKKAKNQIKENARKVYSLASNEAGKVKDAVFKGNDYKDKDLIGNINYNSWVLMDRIQSGVLFDLAKKYGVAISMSRINAFVEQYEHLDHL